MRLTAALPVFLLGTSLAARPSGPGAQTQGVVFDWVRSPRAYLSQFCEPGAVFRGEALEIAGQRYPFKIAADGNSVSVAVQPGGAPSKTLRPGQSFDLQLPLSLSGEISVPKPLTARSCTLLADRDLLGVWRAFPVTVARAKVKDFIVTIVDLNLNGIYGEPWKDGLVVDPALRPWQTKGQSVPPYLNQNKAWPAAYRFPDTGPVRRGETAVPWRWNTASPFRKRFPVEQSVLEFSPGAAAGGTKAALEPFLPGWPDNRRRFLVALNRMRLHIGLTSCFGSDKTGGNRDMPLLTEEAISDPDFAYVPANDRNFRHAYLDPRTRSFSVDIVDIPLRRGAPMQKAFVVDGSDLDPEARWSNGPVIWPPPECERYPWRRMDRGIDWDDDAHPRAAPDVPREIRMGARGSDSTKDSGPAITLTFEERDPRIGKLVCRMWEVPGGPESLRNGPARDEQEIVVWYFCPGCESRKHDPGYRPGVDNGQATHMRGGSNHTIHVIPNHRLKPGATFRIHIAFEWGAGRNWEKSWWVQTTPPGLLPGYKSGKD
jgi:hypothetical protein